MVRTLLDSDPGLVTPAHVDVPLVTVWIHYGPLPQILFFLPVAFILLVIIAGLAFEEGKRGPIAQRLPAAFILAAASIVAAASTDWILTGGRPTLPPEFLGKAIALAFLLLYARVFWRRTPTRGVLWALLLILPVGAWGIWQLVG